MHGIAVERVEFDFVQVRKIEQVADAFLQRGRGSAVAFAQVSKALDLIRRVQGEDFGTRVFAEQHPRLTAQPVRVQPGKLLHEVANAQIGRPHQTLCPQIKMQVFFMGEFLTPCAALAKEHAQRDSIQQVFICHAPIARCAFSFHRFKRAVQREGPRQGRRGLCIGRDAVLIAKGAQIAGRSRAISSRHGQRVNRGVGHARAGIAPGLAVQDLKGKRIAVVGDQDVDADKGLKREVNFLKCGAIAFAFSQSHGEIKRFRDPAIAHAHRA